MPFRLVPVRDLVALVASTTLIRVVLTPPGYLVMPGQCSAGSHRLDHQEQPKKLGLLETEKMPSVHHNYPRGTDTVRVLGNAWSVQRG